MRLFVLLCACSGSTTVVTPAAVEDRLFATWEISSAAFGPVACATVGATSVTMDLVNVSSGERFIETFDCGDYQGTSAPLSVGSYDVLIDLEDAGGATLSQVDLGTDNISTAGTIDLGHVVFRVP